jgi:Helicase associated domain
VFRLMLEYVAANGDARVPTNYTVGGVRLQGWVIEQRTRYSQGRLEPERQRRLEELPGWSWNPYADQWEKAFQMLLEYAKEHGTSRVPYPYEVDGIKLGVWVRGQRNQYAKGKLDPSRQRRLERLPGWMWTP